MYVWRNEGNKSYKALYLFILILLVIILNVWVYLEDYAFFIEMNIKNLIIFIFSGLFHYVLTKPFYYLRGKKHDETYAEHYILLFIGLGFYFIYYYYFTSNSNKYDILTYLDEILMIIFSIPIIYVSAINYPLFFGKSWYVIDIISQIFAIYLSCIVFHYLFDYALIFFLILIAGFLYFLLKSKKI